MKHDPKDYPTPIELAKIAAPLAAGKRNAQYSDAAKSALELWKACAAELEYVQLIDEAGKKDRNLYGHLDKEHYTRDEFLCEAFKNKLTESDRMAEMREFLNAHLLYVKATEKNVLPETLPAVSHSARNKFLEELKKDGLTADEFIRMLKRVESWKKIRLKKRASKAGKASAAKKTEKIVFLGFSL